MLNDPCVEPSHKVYSVFVLSCLVDNYPIGQESAKHNHLIALCTCLITDKHSKDYQNSLLRQWCCICLGLCWQNYPDARWEGVRNTAHQFLIELISDPVPEVRAAAIFALGTYIGCGPGNEGSQEQTNKLDSEIVNALIKDYDIVYIVRKELIAALFNYINQFLINSPATTLNNTNSTTNPNMPIKYASSGCHSSGNSSFASSNNNNNNSSGGLIKSQSSQSLVQQSGNRMGGLQKIQTIYESPTSRLVQSTSVNQDLNNSVQSPNSSEYYSNTSSTVNSILSPALGSLSFSNRAATNSGSPVASILSNTNKSIYVLFNKVWHLLVDMQSDPYPDVAEFAQKVVAFFVTRAHCFDRLKQNTILQQQHLQQNVSHHSRQFSNDLTNRSGKNLRTF